MPVVSAGILLYRRRASSLEVLLAHPGGPFWAKKDEASWTIPKGLVDPGEDVMAAARREFTEETGFVPPGDLVSLGDFLQPGGKKVLSAFALEGDFDPEKLISNSFEMEWPPRSGRMQSFPEIDRAQWFDIEAARTRMLKGQRPILDALLAHVGGA